VRITDFLEMDEHYQSLTSEVLEQLEIQVKYEGYIKRQDEEIEKFKKLEHILIPEEFEYGSVKGFRAEALEKFEKFRPRSAGQASRISGITPSDIAVLMVYLKNWKKSKQAAPAGV